MKITTEICKKALVLEAALIKEDIRSKFIPLLTDLELAQTLLTKNWKRFSKTKTDINIYNNEVGEFIERGFDCSPFDDQLRGYIYTDKKDEKIFYTSIHGE